MNQNNLEASDPDAFPWWQGVSRGELLYQRCDDCHKSIFYPRSLCPSCFSTNLSWNASAGLGRVYSVTVVHRAPKSLFDGDPPYQIALVDLDEGFRMMTRLVDISSTSAKIGDRVSLVFRKLRDGRDLPCFTLVSK